jgi:phosphoribosyl-AMP cyclohydrolase
MIVQDHESRDVLMVAWVNREALEKTIETGKATFWSRSRKKLWRKGESSGNVMRVKELRFDCDADTILALVEPAGPACHEGYRSCFFRRLEPLAADGELKVFCEREVDPEELYGKKG